MISFSVSCRYYRVKYVLVRLDFSILRNNNYNGKMEIFEEEIEIYNAKMRLLTWLYDEIKIQSDLSKDLLNEKGQKLPLNH